MSVNRGTCCLCQESARHKFAFMTGVFLKNCRLVSTKTKKRALLRKLTHHFMSMFEEVFLLCFCSSYTCDVLSLHGHLWHDFFDWMWCGGNISWFVSTTVGWIGAKFGRHIHVSLRMNCNNFGEPLISNTDKTIGVPISLSRDLWWVLFSRC